MSWRRTKNVQRRYKPDEFAAIAEQAAKTSRNHAARKFRCSTKTVSKAMRMHGVTPRRQGNFTTAEANALRGWKP
jgi:hypothetical protein